MSDKLQNVSTLWIYNGKNRQFMNKKLTVDCVDINK